MSDFARRRVFTGELNMTESQKLLAQYAANGSEEAFRELVERYVNLVYSTALRLVDGDTHRAQDVAQEVFMDLASLARGVSGKVMLGGWLHRHTCFLAAKTLRREHRRQNRERQATEMNAIEDHAQARFEQLAPILDEAINQLSTPDRTAIVLRFFEGQDLHSVGQALATNDDAAQKRVARALEKLRLLLVRRGVALSGGVLAAVLGTEVVNAAPAGLAVSIASAALASAAAAGSGGLTVGVLKVIAMTKLKMAVGTLVVAGLGTTVVLDHQAWSRLRQQNEALRGQIQQLKQQAEEPQAQIAPVAQAGAPASPGAQQLRDLSRLRTQAGALRQQTNELVRLKAENRRLRYSWSAGDLPPPDEPESPAEAEFRKEAQDRHASLKQWGLLFRMYMLDHQHRFPETWEQVADQIDPAGRAALLSFATNGCDIIYHGDETGLSNRWDTILFSEKQAWHSPNGEWVKMYGLADGSADIRVQPDRNFDAYEQEHTIRRN